MRKGRGIAMKRLVIYIHGKGGNAQEAEHYRSLFAGSDVVGFDYKAQNPWEAEREFPLFYDRHSKGYDTVLLVANSIGAYFSMHALAGKGIAGALFISPIVDMEKLIEDMMRRSSVTEAELCTRREIPTAFGETLSWAYLCYVREHPVAWDVPTCILYGGKDNLTSAETVSAFARRIGASLTVMEDGEHWFHTDEQMRFLDGWIKKSMRSDFGG